MLRAMGYAGAWHIDMSRCAQEQLPPQVYLAVSYYRRWALAWRRTLLERGFVDADEIAAGHALHPGKPLQRKLTADVVAAGHDARLVLPPAAGACPLQAGRPRAHAEHPSADATPGCRATCAAKSGVVELVHGCHAFPDSVAIGRGDDPQWLYTVVFDGREIWGADADPTLEDLDRRLRAVSRAGVTDDASPRIDRMPRDRCGVPSMPRDAEGPVFREPWEAQAFAMALALHERGLFTWPEWAATLGDEIKRAQAAGDPDTGETYYRHWLNALERLVAEKGVTDARDAGALPRRLGSRRRPHAARRSRSSFGRKISRRPSPPTHCAPAYAHAQAAHRRPTKRAGMRRSGANRDMSRSRRGA